MAFGIFSLTVAIGTPGTAQTETILYNFPSQAENASIGTFPSSGLVSDGHGNVFGTTALGGTVGYGTVFELTPASGGGWNQQVVFSFTGGADGVYPSSLTFDSVGNLYGETLAGGQGTCASIYGSGCGTVFRLVHASGGAWTHQVLHRFSYKGDDGALPNGGLIVDGRGNIYGTTTVGGTGLCTESTAGPVVGCGTVFKLSRTSRGAWNYSVLHNFHGTGESGTAQDGRWPSGGVTLDSSGNVYGTTAFGGFFSHGMVFKLSPTRGVPWTEKFLHSFGRNSTDGLAPSGGLVLDAAGNLYGTTANGGTAPCTNSFNGNKPGCGTVFKLSLKPNGRWSETILYSFGENNTTDGWFPTSSLIFDALGNLYGTTSVGGVGCKDMNGLPRGCGTVFELSPKSGGGWTETVLHFFLDLNSQGFTFDGQGPNSALVRDAGGNLYGTTAAGGNNGTKSGGGGTAFEITP